MCVPVGAYDQWCCSLLVGRELDAVEIATAQTLAPKDITGTRWKQLYPGYFGFIFAPWEKVKTCRPSLYTVFGWTSIQLFKMLPDAKITASLYWEGTDQDESKLYFCIKLQYIQYVHHMNQFSYVSQTVTE